MSFIIFFEGFSLHCHCVCLMLYLNPNYVSMVRDDIETGSKNVSRSVSLF